MAKRNNDQAAQILVEALFEADAKVVKRHRITLRTLQNYKAALATDDELSLAFAKHYALFRGHEVQASEFSAAEAQVKLNHWMLEMELTLSHMVSQAKGYWLELKTEAKDFSQKMQVFHAALSFMAQLGEPLVVREVLGGGRNDSAEGESLSATAEGSSEQGRSTLN